MRESAGEQVCNCVSKLASERRSGPGTSQSKKNSSFQFRRTKALDHFKLLFNGEDPRASSSIGDKTVNALAPLTQLARLFSHSNSLIQRYQIIS